MDDEKTKNAADIGRIIKLLLDEKGITLGEPPQLVEKYVARKLKRFSTKKLDIFNIRFDIPGLLSFKLLQGGEIHIGGSGVVLQVVNPYAPSIRYGLKFLKPSFLDNPDHRDRVFTDSKKEFLRHVPLLHTNVGRIFGTSEKPLIERGTGGQPLSFEPILMEWIEGAKPLANFLLKVFRDNHLAFFDTAIDLMIQCFSALSYIHSHEIIHWDIKGDNFLVNSAGIAKLVDIGNARILSDAERGDIALTTRGNFPSGLDPYVVAEEGPLDSSKRTRIDLNGDLFWDCKWLDMWMLAREFMEFLKEEKEPYQLSALHRIEINDGIRIAILRKLIATEPDESEFILRCLRLILRRILVATSPKNNVYYGAAEDVVADLSKIRPAFGDAQDVRELSAVPQRILRIPVSGNVPYTERVARIFNSELLQRLRGHFQLGPVYQVYPGATHRRSEHAAGVLRVTCDYIRALFADKLNPFWRLTVTKTDIECLLVAALIHDIGHISFGHFLEEMEGMMRGRTHEDYVISVLDRNRQSPSFDPEVTLRDRNTLISAIFEDPKNLPLEDIDAFLNNVANILRPHPAKAEVIGMTTRRAEQPFDDPIYNSTKCEAIKFFVMHSILDSAIDADKLDYLLRDAHYCGIKYASGIDTDRFFQSLTVVSDLFKLTNGPEAPASSTNTPCIGVSRKGILPLESILIARDQLFRSVYWHHTVRAETAMLQFAVGAFIGAGLSFGPGDDSETSRRIGELVFEFRTNSDDNAILWLKSEIPKRVKAIPLQKRLLEICECVLGERRFLYKEIFALTYEAQSSDERYQSKINLRPSELYASLNKWSHVANSSRSPLAYLESVRGRRQILTDRLAHELHFALKDGDVLIDIPPSGRDQVDNIFIDCGDVIRSIHDVSFMGHAVRYSFANWTRTARIFVAPEAIEKCEIRGVTRVQLAGLCDQVIQKLVKDEQPQAEFDLK